MSLTRNIKTDALTSNRFLATTVSAALLVGLAACAADDPNRRAKTGAGIGAVLGAVIGSQIGDDNELLGAAIGALAGGAVGHYQDKQQRALEVALENELLQQQVNVERLDNDVLLVRLNDGASFDFDSAALKDSFRPTLDKIAAETSTYCLLYTSPSPRDKRQYRMPSSA